MNTIDIDKIYKRRKSDRDIFQELMPFKVKEILLIANYYDAYTIEREGQFSGKIFGEYLQLNLYTAPRFTSAATLPAALRHLQRAHFDLVIIMAGLDKETPLHVSREIQRLHPAVHQLMLVSSNADLAHFRLLERDTPPPVERLFAWNGDTKLFLAMAKYIEDKINLPADTRLGDTRVILLVEDSIPYYSRYLPLLYTEIMTQTQAIIADNPGDDEMATILKTRVRPKVALVSTYEAATDIIDRYRDNIIGVISDVRYPRAGIEDENAGVELIQHVHRLDNRIPCLLQSHEPRNQQRAAEIGAAFIDKNSITLAREIKNYIRDRLGFGDFIFRDNRGTPIDRATTIEEFRQKLATIPDQSLEYHARRNGISTWLMARAEINLAKKLRRYTLADFKNTAETRQFIANVFEASRLKKLRGRVINFTPELVHSNRYITRLGKGSLGGKGRGMAFLSNFIENVYLKKLIPSPPVTIPETAVIGVDEFDNFIESNDLYNVAYIDKDPGRLAEAFRRARLPENLRRKLRRYLAVIRHPLAVRSSGLFEDSLDKPFAGVYATYLVPNNHPDDEQRLRELEDAIKLVYASIFSPGSRAYFNAIDYMIEDEKMAVILQQVIGRQHGDTYYPDISGVAQSYNFYPFSYIRPDDGFAVIAVGLGAYVVGGEPTHRFCPAYPRLQLASTDDKTRDTQRHFYALDLATPTTPRDLYRDGEHAAITRLPITRAEADGTLRHAATVHDFMNDRLTHDLSVRGTRLIDFSRVLQYDSFPLAPALRTLLDIFANALGSPVEIEFAVNIENDNPTFYLLQIKPLIKNEYDIDIAGADINPERVLLKAARGMGNGKIEEIRHVVYVDPGTFDRLRTTDIAAEIKHHNDLLAAEGEAYILVGPGRWGTRDPLTGIPVAWADIAAARVIVEQGLPDFPLDASLGSHFFHNVTSMNIGYFAIPDGDANAFIDFSVLGRQPVVEQLSFSRRVRFDEPLTVWMDGKKQEAVITY